MHCVGCWAGEYGHKNNLSFEDMDKIITEGKELGSISICSPAASLWCGRRIFSVWQKAQRCAVCDLHELYLIDEPFCEEVVKLGNIAFMLSIEELPLPMMPGGATATMPLS